MKHIIKKSLLLVTIGLLQLVDLNPVYANSVEFIVNDSLHANVSSVKFSENAPISKISTPDKNMIRKADNEMHRNMKADLAETISMMKIWRTVIPADQTLNQQFYQLSTIRFDHHLEHQDEKLNLFFQAENIRIINKASVQNSDNQINKNFYSSK